MGSTALLFILQLSTGRRRRKQPVEHRVVEMYLVGQWTKPNFGVTVVVVVVVVVVGVVIIIIMCYKSEGRWFDPSWCHWNFSLT